MTLGVSQASAAEPIERLDLIAMPGGVAAIHARRARVSAGIGDETQALAWWRQAAAASDDTDMQLALVDALPENMAGCAEADAIVADLQANCGAACVEVNRTRASVDARCTGSIRAVSEPAGARLSIGKTPLGAAVFAGPTRLRAVWPDGTERRISICVEPGGVTTLTVPRDGAIAVDPTGPVAARAHAHRHAGFAWVSRGDVCAAVAEFEASMALRPEPEIHIDRAQALALDPDRCAASSSAFERYLEACGDCRWRGLAERMRGTLRDECGGILQVRVDTPGVRVRVDGRPSSLESVQLPGVREITVEARGHHPVTTFGAVARGETRIVSVALLPVMPSPGLPSAPAAARPGLPALPPIPMPSADAIEP